MDPGAARRERERERHLAEKQAECVRALHRLCGEDPRSLQIADVNSLLQSWLVDFDRGEKLWAGLDAALDGYNQMHLVGVAICEALDRHQLEVDLARAEQQARSAAPRAFPCGTAIAQQSAAELLDTTRGLQIAFAGTYTLGEDGYDCAVDTTAVLIAVMRRLGFWVAREFKADAKDDLDAQILSSMEPRPGDWLGVKRLLLVQVLDAVHAMLSVHRLLLGAEMIEVAGELQDFDNFSLEASGESWYNVSMASDLVPGAVCQYKHEFGELFHSLSQVVYYHEPNYARTKQLSLAELNGVAAPGVHVLPLLMELAPDVPVLYEHTGVGFRGTHAKHKFSWVLCQKLVVLVGEDMRSYCCKSLRGLLKLIDGGDA